MTVEVKLVDEEMVVENAGEVVADAVEVFEESFLIDREVGIMCLLRAATRMMIEERMSDDAILGVVLDEIAEETTPGDQ